MSNGNVTPIRTNPAPAPQVSPAPGMWWDGCNWVMPPIWPPQHPPGCGCGSCCQPQPPSCWSEIAKLEACFASTEAFNKFLADAINRLIEQGLINPLPATGPILGVTDGIAAGPGIVGEFLRAEVSGTGTAPATVPYTTVISPIILPPGDWDVDAFMILASWSSATLFSLSPMPAGASGPMETLISTGSPAIQGPETGIVSMAGPRERVLASAPTLLAYSIYMRSDATPLDCPYTFSVTARRMR